MDKELVIALLGGLALALGIAGWGAIVMLVRWLIRLPPYVRIATDEKCLACRYAMAGLATDAPCPECGAGRVDPASEQRLVHELLRKRPVRRLLWCVLWLQPLSPVVIAIPAIMLSRGRLPWDQMVIIGVSAVFSGLALGCVALTLQGIVIAVGSRKLSNAHLACIFAASVAGMICGCVFAYVLLTFDDGSPVIGEGYLLPYSCFAILPGMVGLFSGAAAMVVDARLKAGSTNPPAVTSP